MSHFQDQFSSTVVSDEKGKSLPPDKEAQILLDSLFSSTRTVRVIAEMENRAMRYKLTVEFCNDMQQRLQRLSAVLAK